MTPFDTYAIWDFISSPGGSLLCSTLLGGGLLGGIYKKAAEKKNLSIEECVAVLDSYAQAVDDFIEILTNHQLANIPSNETITDSRKKLSQFKRELGKSRTRFIKRVKHENKQTQFSLNHMEWLDLVISDEGFIHRKADKWSAEKISEILDFTSNHREYISRVRLSIKNKSWKIIKLKPQ